MHDFQEAWRPFVILGCVNLEDLCEVYLKTRDDWDNNFKACKQFSQQIAKIPGYAFECCAHFVHFRRKLWFLYELALSFFRTESRIDCFVINTSPLRSDIEFISRKYWETLTYSLRTSILKDMTTLQDFLNTSTQVLQSVAVMEEQYIEESAVKCEQIVSELPTVYHHNPFALFQLEFSLCHLA